MGSLPSRIQGSCARHPGGPGRPGFAAGAPPAGEERSPGRHRPRVCRRYRWEVSREMVHPPPPQGRRVEALSRLSGRCRLRGRVGFVLGLPRSAERPQETAQTDPEAPLGAGRSRDHRGYPTAVLAGEFARGELPNARTPGKGARSKAVSNDLTCQHSLPPRTLPHRIDFGGLHKGAVKWEGGRHLPVTWEPGIDLTRLDVSDACLTTDLLSGSLPLSLNRSNTPSVPHP